MSRSKQLKIAYLLDDTLDKPDGVQQCVVTIGEYMRSMGHEVHYLVAQTNRKDLDNVHSLANFVSLKFNSNSVRTPLPASKRKIKLLLDSLDIDVLHVQMPYSPMFASRVIRACGPRVKIVGTWHTFPAGLLQRLSHIPLYWAIRRSLRRVEVTIGVSKPTAQFADKIYKTKSVVVPNAVDIKRFRVELNKPKAAKKIVFLGRFDERKGPMKLIEAIGFLKSNNFASPAFDFEVVMGGKGPDLTKCIYRADQLGLRKTITFPGFIDDAEKPKFLASADISVFPSTGGEAFGISVVEAMASGESIVLAGDNSGYRSILGEKPELLFNPCDTEKFATRLLHYMTASKTELDTTKRWLKQNAAQYDVPLICERLLSYYHSK